MVEIYDMLRASSILGQNIAALLKARGQSQHDLAMWCRHSDVWLSNFLAGKRQIQIKDLDRIADFFGLATYQLFQPGITPLYERRRAADRRAGRDRRIGHMRRLMLGLGSIEPYRHATDPAIAAELQRLTEAHEQEVSALLSSRKHGGQTPSPRGTLPAAPKSRRAVRGSDS